MVLFSLSDTPRDLNFSYQSNLIISIPFLSPRVRSLKRMFLFRGFSLPNYIRLHFLNKLSINSGLHKSYRLSDQFHKTVSENVIILNFCKYFLDPSSISISQQTTTQWILDNHCSFHVSAVVLILSGCVPFAWSTCETEKSCKQGYGH